MAVKAAKPKQTLTADEVAQLLASEDHAHVACMEQWSPSEAALEIASLANTEGGCVVVPGAVDLSEGDLRGAGALLQPAGPRLLRAELVDGPDGPVGVIRVREAADLPVLAGELGAILTRDSNGRRPVTSRDELDPLIARAARLRARAESVIDSQTERTAFGHLNYLTIALIVVPLTASTASFEWARDNAPEILRTRIALASGFKRDAVSERGGLFEIRELDDETAFISVAKNGTITTGMHRMRPALDRFVQPMELAGLGRDMAQAASLIAAGGDAGLVRPAVFVQGMRNLRLEAIGGFGAQAKRDQQRTLLRPQYLETPEDEEALGAGLLDVLSTLFSADLVAGSVEPFSGDVANGPAPKAWHGKTKRTERRTAFQRAHGS
jgi:hypothetical protein